VIGAYMSHALFGLYVWEIVTTLDYEWELLTRRRPFRWPMVRPSL
jgi:hypothetical protein